MTNTIDLFHDSGAVKTVMLPEPGVPRHGVLDGHRCAMAFWPGNEMPVWIDLDTGRLLYQGAPLRAGFYEVDLETGRLLGSSWRVPMTTLENMAEAMIGADVTVEHVVTGDAAEVQLVDIETIRARARVMTTRDSARGRCVPTGWRASSEALQALRGPRAA